MEKNVKPVHRIMCNALKCADLSPK